MRRPLRTLCAVACLIAIAAGAAWAAPPEGEEARQYRGYEGWFKKLWNPMQGIACCDVSDCRFVSYRPTANGYVIEINGQSVPVPPHAVIDRPDNPTGRGVACYRPSGNPFSPLHIMCFIRAAEG
jgi:hypothetical protein